MEEVVIVGPCGESFSVNQDLSLGLGGEVWTGAFGLAAYLEASRVTGARVLEVGAGCHGIMSLFLSHMPGFSSVLATDGDKNLLPLLEDNIANNHSCFHTKVTSQHLLWGDDEAKNLGEFDLIVGAEVVYRPSSGGDHEDGSDDSNLVALLKTLQLLCAPDGKVVISFVGLPVTTIKDLKELTAEQVYQLLPDSAFARFLQLLNLEANPVFALTLKLVWFQCTDKEDGVTMNIASSTDKGAQPVTILELTKIDGHPGDEFHQFSKRRKR